MLEHQNMEYFTKTESSHSIRHILRHESSEVHAWNCKNDQYVEPHWIFLMKKQNPYIDILRESSMKSLKDLFDVSQGMVTGADKVKKDALANRCYEDVVGEGIFVVSTCFFEDLPKEEQVLLKRWFKNSDISRFSISDEKLGSYVLQLTSDTDISKYPVIQEHLLKYKEIILGRNYDSGELKRAKKKGAWWALSSSRKDFDFFNRRFWFPIVRRKYHWLYKRGILCSCRCFLLRKIKYLFFFGSCTSASSKLFFYISIPKVEEREKCSNCTKLLWRRYHYHN